MALIESRFTTTLGTPIDDRKIRKEFNALVTAAKLPKQRFHDLRHACISLLAAQSVPLKAIAEIAGHSDARLTQNVYQHVYRDAKRDAADKIDALTFAFRFGRKPGRYHACYQPIRPSP